MLRRSLQWQGQMSPDTVPFPVTSTAPLLLNPVEVGIPLDLSGPILCTYIPTLVHWQVSHPDQWHSFCTELPFLMLCPTGSSHFILITFYSALWDCVLCWDPSSKLWFIGKLSAGTKLGIYGAKLNFPLCKTHSYVWPVAHYLKTAVLSYHSL